jgi:hypothetical protein
MSITIDISDEVLREAEAALNIHDPARLFLSLLEEKLARHAAQRRLSALSGTMPDLDLPPRQRPTQTQD